MAHPLARIIEQLKREPSRTGSIVITVFGDAIVPRGGLGLARHAARIFQKALDIDSGVVRTAMSRLAADGWLERSKVGPQQFLSAGKERTPNLRCSDQAYLRSAAIGLDRTL